MTLSSTLTLALVAASLAAAAMPARAQDAAAAAAPEPVASAARAPLPAGDTVAIPLPGGGSFGGDVTMVAQLFRPAGPGPFPVVVFSHGRAPDAAERSRLKVGISNAQLRFWLARGDAVVAPVRPGYGATGGADVESNGARFNAFGACTTVPDYRTGSAAARKTVDAALRWLATQPWADTRHVLLAGQSAGGLATVTAGAANPAGVVGYINYAGGNGGNPSLSPGHSCDPAQLERLYGEFGRVTTVPSLWIYAENDQYFGADAPVAWHAAFAQGGSRTTFVHAPAVADGNGHGLSTHPAALWSGYVQAFLATIPFDRPADGAGREGDAPAPVLRIGKPIDWPARSAPRRSGRAAMSDNAIVQIQALGFPWETADPFLFCVHHDDAYPQGNGRFGPAASLAGRNIGQDFGRKDGWSMYHGQQVPGFPSHPHRGFETVTIVRQGLTDHADSLGAAARFGGGDVQWLTAGKGIAHSEMFPLLETDRANPLELFQIWLNLPARSKMCEPHFTMLWAEDIPHRFFDAGNGALTEVAVIAGRLDAPDAAEPLAPPPDSWAAQAEADVAIWTLRMAPGARWTLPPAATAAARRKLYFFAGTGASVAGQAIAQHAAIELRAASAVELVNTGADVVEFLMLQGRPIGEAVAQYGPFVMNTEAELRQAFDDYRRTEFGGWPWPDPAPVHGPERVRFARHAGGRVETRAEAGGAAAVVPSAEASALAGPAGAEAGTASAVLMENASRGIQ